MGSRDGGRGVTDPYSMHNNRLRLPTCIPPSISPWLSHLRPMETHTNTHTRTSLQRHRRLAASCYPSWLSKEEKKSHPDASKLQLTWRRSHWQGRLRLTKPLPMSGTFPKKRSADMPTQRKPYACHVNTLSQSDTHAHTHLDLYSKIPNSEILRVYGNYKV